MFQLLEHTTNHTDTVRPEVRGPVAPGGPPSAVGTGRWPFRAKTAVAVLAALALAGGVASAIGFTRAESIDDEKATVELSRDTALADLADTRSELTAATERATVAEQANDAYVAQIDRMGGELTSAQATIDELTSAATASLAERVQLRLDLQAVQATADEAAAARDAYAALFPMTFDASLKGVDVTGTYGVKLTQAYCAGFNTCGTLPAITQMTIRTTTQGYLELVVNGKFTMPLFAIDGALYGITDSSTLLPAGNGTNRLARVAVTVYAHGITVHDDGSRHIDDLGASIAIQANATGSNPAGLAFYGASLTP